MRTTINLENGTASSNSGTCCVKPAATSARNMQNHPLERQRRQGQARNTDEATVIWYGIGMGLGIVTFKFLKRSVRKVPFIGRIVSDVMPATLLGAIAGASAVHTIQDYDAHNDKQRVGASEARRLQAPHARRPGPQPPVHRVHAQTDTEQRAVNTMHNSATRSAKIVHGHDSAQPSRTPQRIIKEPKVRQRQLTERQESEQANQLQEAAADGLKQMAAAAQDAAATVQAGAIAAAAVVWKEVEHHEYERQRAAGHVNMAREVDRFLYNNQPAPLGVKFQRVYEPTKRKLQQQ